MSSTVTLTVRADSTAWGETVGIAGSIPQLSTWGATAPPPLTASPFPTWSITLTLPADTTVHYKYVILTSCKIVRWEVLPSGEENRSFTTPANGETLTIDDGCMGDATRTSTTVTPSTTPTTTPTRPQKQPELITDLTDLTPSSPQTDPEPTDFSLADFTAQLDNSRRQVEHVRAAVRRIRHIPTPDALPTPPGTPDQSTRLSHDAAAALASNTLSEAKADVELIREKLRAVRGVKEKAVASSPNFLILVGMLSFGVALIAIGAVLANPRATVHAGRAVRNAGEKLLGDALEARGKVIVFRKTTWEAAKCLGMDIRLKTEKRLLQTGQGVAYTLERAKLRVVLDWMATLSRVRTVVQDGAIERMKKIIARVSEHRVDRFAH